MRQTFIRLASRGRRNCAQERTRETLARETEPCLTQSGGVDQESLGGGLVKCSVCIEPREAGPARQGAVGGLFESLKEMRYGSRCP
jgi:hypothetical protein